MAIVALLEPFVVHTSQPHLKARKLSMNRNAELESLEEYFKLILADKSKRQDLSAKEGDSAQQWLDRMQQLVDYPNLSPELRPKIFTAMLRLSKRSGLHPACLSIQNVKKIGKRPVASGGFADVWKGTIGDSSEVVCLKVVRAYLDSDMLKLSIEYQREAILWRQMKHSNLLPLLGLYRLEETDELCFISPWMEKGNLVEYMKITKREDIDHYTLVHDIASGLAYLHSKKIVHGDLKGVNVLITRLLRACIADFGLSRIADTQSIGVNSSTRSAGTMRWLAPELLSGDMRPSKMSDMYSFACVCYEIFTGLLPFAELRNDMAVMFAVTQGKCPSRPQVLELSDAMWALMTGCWNQTAEARPTADQVLEKVREMTPHASESVATDWSDSLLTHVRENVEYRSFSSESPDGFQRGPNHGFSRGGLPEDIDVSQYPPKFKKEGADWFALFYPSVKEESDVRLAHIFKHDSIVCCVRFSEDGKYVATGGNQTTQIYDVNTGVKICLLVDKATRDAGALFIRSVCFSPNGKYLVTGADDKLIRIWDIGTKRIRMILRGHGQEICSVDFSSDGRLLASGSCDRTVRVWDMIDGSSKTFIDSVTHSDIQAGITSVKFSSDGRYVAAGYMDCCVRIWEVATGQLIERARGHQGIVNSLAFTPDASGLVSASFDKTLKYWDVSSRNRLNGSPCTMNFVGHKDHVFCVAVSRDGEYIASGSKDCGVRIWDPRNATTQCLLHGHKDSVFAVDFSPSGDVLATVGGDWEVRIWSYALKTWYCDSTPISRPIAAQVYENVGEMVPSVSEPAPPAWGDSLLTYAPENVYYRSFFSESPDSAQRGPNHGFSRGEFPEDIDFSQYPPEFVKEGADWCALINPSVKKGSDVSLAHTLEHDSVVCCVRFSADGKYVATVCRRTTQIYDVNTGVKTCLLVDEAAGDADNLYIFSVCFSPDGKHLATGAEDKLIRIWDIEEKQIRTIFRGHSEGVNSVDFSPDGRLLASASYDKTIRIWDTIDGSSNTFIDPVTYFYLNVKAGAMFVNFSFDGRYVAAGYLDGCARIWGVATGQLVERLRGHQDSVIGVAFTPDARGLVSGSLDKTLKYWDMSGQNRLNESPCTKNFVGHKDGTLGVAVSRDGKYIASGSLDRGVRIWDSRNATTQCLLQGHKDTVLEVDFSPSGGVLATASMDKTARIWRYKLN
ncbi:hypothetical protein PQX77_007632 [Marasmius sp. AFHP31]|nr:hypothetical protein PQX77_007632 [Marasmius sp. AFHP31]